MDPQEARIDFVREGTYHPGAYKMPKYHDFRQVRTINYTGNILSNSEENLKKFEENVSGHIFPKNSCMIYSTLVKYNLQLLIVKVQSPSVNSFNSDH